MIYPLALALLFCSWRSRSLAIDRSVGMRSDMFAHIFSAHVCFAQDVERDANSVSNTTMMRIFVVLLSLRLSVSLSHPSIALIRLIVNWAGKRGRTLRVDNRPYSTPFSSLLDRWCYLAAQRQAGLSLSISHQGTMKMNRGESKAVERKKE